MPFFTFGPEIIGVNGSSEWEIVCLCISFATRGGRRSEETAVMNTPGATVAGCGDNRRLAASMAKGREIVGGGCIGTGIGCGSGCGVFGTAVEGGDDA